MMRAVVLCHALLLPAILGGCLQTVAAAAGGVVGPAVLGTLNSKTEALSTYSREIDERRSAVRHARYQEEDAHCRAISAAAAAAAELQTQEALYQRAVACWKGYYQKPFEGDILSGFSEND